MPIGRNYLLKKPDGPSAPKLFLDTRVVPAAANMAGGVEVALDRAARGLHVRPRTIVLAGLGGLAVLAFRGLRARPAAH